MLASRGQDILSVGWRDLGGGGVEASLVLQINIKWLFFRIQFLIFSILDFGMLTAPIIGQ